MPVPAAIIGPGTVIAVKKLAFHILTSCDISALSSATFTVICLRYLYQSLPAWVRDDISFKNLFGGGGGQGSSSNGFKVQHVTEKISKLKALLNHKKHDFSLPAVLALIQLSAQLKLEQTQNTHVLDTAMLISGDEKREDYGTADTARTTTIPSTSKIIKETLNVRDEIYARAGDAVEKALWRSDEIKHALDLATWSYHEDSRVLEHKLLEHGYGMLSHQLSVRPGTVAHYVAVHPPRRTVVVSLRGTSSFEDFLTDCLGLPLPLVEDNSLLERSFRVEVKAAAPNVVMVDSLDGTAVEIVSGHERIMISQNPDDDGDIYPRCHEGMLMAARNILDVIGDVLRDYVHQCDYKIMFVGHSLGAGTAVVAAQLLMAKYPELTFSGFKSSDRIHVYAFAPPPVLDHDTAIAASSFCTTIINGADIIPRCSVSAVLSTLAVLSEVESRMEKLDINPTDPGRTIKFLNKLSEGENGKPLMTAAEFFETVRKSQLDVELRKPQHLFVPGRIFLIYKTSNSEICPDYRCVETIGTNTIFQTLEVDGLQCFTDHLTIAYYEALGSEYTF